MSRIIIAAIGLLMIVATHGSAEPLELVVVTAAVPRAVPFEGWAPGILVLRGTTGRVAASHASGELTVVWESGILINAGNFLRRNIVDRRVPFRDVSLEGYEPLPLVVPSPGPLLP